MPNLSDTMASRLMADSIDLSRFEAGVTSKLVAIYRDLERQLIAYLLRYDPTAPSASAYQYRRADALLAEVRQVIRTSYTRMNRLEATDLKSLAVTEAASIQAMAVELTTIPLFSVSVPEATLRALVDDLTIQGQPLRTWWSRQATTTFDRYASVVRQGIIRGDSVGDMVQALRGTRETRYADGVLRAPQRGIETLVRTSVQAVANESRLATFQANSDVLRGFEWLTGMDALVCPVCAALSSSTWTLDYRRLPGTRLPFPGAPPRH